MVTLNPVQRDRLEAFAKDQRTVFDFEQLFAAVIELQSTVVALQAASDERVGSIVWSAAATYEGAMLARGASLLRADYPALFAKIGTVFGAADADHFNVPDIGGRVVAGSEAAASRLTSGVSGVAGNTLGAAGGDQRLHAHAHSIATYASGATGAAGRPEEGTSGSVSTVNTANAGAGNAQNVQPTIVLNAFILY